VNTATISMIIIAACGALFAGMAGLIRSMVLSRLDRDQEALMARLQEIQTQISGLSRELHRVDVRLTKVEAEHAMLTCMERTKH
jgi:ABC-type phosphate transport system auxiliary subunit